MLKQTKYRLLILLSVVIFFISIGRGLSKEEEVTLERMPIDNDIFNGEISWNYQAGTNASEVNESTINIIGIHGTPGSWTAWRALMQEPAIKDFNFYAFNRPGWDESQSIDQQVYPRLQDQAQILASALAVQTAQQRNIVVAHSWGGPVALQLAAQYPELVDGLVLVAAPASPDASRPRWYHKAAKLKPVQWLIGKSMSRSNVEMITLDQELEALEPLLGNIRVPVIIMQGKKDWLVEPENAFYLQRKLINAEVTLEYDLKGNHFIAFSKADEVAQQIIKVANKINTESNASN